MIAEAIDTKSLIYFLSMDFPILFSTGGDIDP